MTKRLFPYKSYWLYHTFLINVNKRPAALFWVPVCLPRGLPIYQIFRQTSWYSRTPIPEQLLNTKPKTVNLHNNGGLTKFDSLTIVYARERCHNMHPLWLSNPLSRILPASCAVHTTIVQCHLTLYLAFRCVTIIIQYIPLQAMPTFLLMLKGPSLVEVAAVSPAQVHAG